MTFQDQFFAGKLSLPKASSPAGKASTQDPPEPSVPTVTVPAYRNRATLASWALLAFSFLYFGRPEDFVPGLSHIPVAKISGGLALLGLLISWKRTRTKMPIEIKLVVVMFLHLCITVPLAWWRGGAADIVLNQFSKAAMVAVLTGLIVSSIQELRR